ncbi:hypothetical protein CPLU01_04079 [Colletotrichum plurivorum]|uniref:Uncharacterized protein n=1 Tax=Colletotrichum plurivorum TaxID=2175906 RepID=A0A8H6NJD8_9PEZI|nr:hypothetical protein CPLU01_04079 [Colletotrichum plurivorum]
MSRRCRSKRRPTTHRQAASESDSGADSRTLGENAPAKGGKVKKNGGPKSRSHHESAKSCRSRRHNRSSCYNETDSDGDLPMLPTPPPTPKSGFENQKRSEHIPSRKHHTSERPQRTPIRGRPEQLGDAGFKNFRFRHQILSLLDQQRRAVEAWADSVGASGPTEPMDWQPEQERVVYFARLPAEDDCYAARWRTGDATEVTPVHPTLGSWAREPLFDGSAMWGAPAGELEIRFQEIE